MQRIQLQCNECDSSPFLCAKKSFCHRTREKLNSESWGTSIKVSSFDPSAAWSGKFFLHKFSHFFLVFVVLLLRRASSRATIKFIHENRLLRHHKKCIIILIFETKRKSPIGVSLCVIFRFKLDWCNGGLGLYARSMCCPPSGIRLLVPCVPLSHRFCGVDKFAIKIDFIASNQDDIKIWYLSHMLPPSISVGIDCSDPVCGQIKFPEKFSFTHTQGFPFLGPLKDFL